MKAWLKSLVQRQLRKRGMILTRDRNDLWVPDFDLLATIIESEFSPSGPSSLIQIGANDGVSHDPVDSLIRRYSMSTIRVEPLPEPFAKLQARHADDANVTTVQAAVDVRDGEQTIWRVRVEGDDAASFSSISSFDRRVVERHRARYRNRGGRLVREQVRTVCPETLVRDHLPANVPLDILQIDAEGHDAVIVEAFLRGGILPRVVNFEHNNLTGDVDRACLQSLRDHGYRLARYGRDTLGIRAPAT